MRITLEPRSGTRDWHKRFVTTKTVRHGQEPQESVFDNRVGDMSAG